jgi:DNA repair protein RadD
MTQDMFEEKPVETAIKEIILRGYQDVAIDDIRTEFKKGHKKVVVQYPTGAGKTVMAMYMVKAAIEKGIRVAFVVDQINLAKQSYETAEEFGIEYGVIQGQHPKKNLDASLQVCTIQSLAKRHKDFGLVIVDECHVMYKAMVEWMERHTGVYFIGLSATPFTRGMGNVWDTLVVGPSTRQLIDLGHLSDFHAYAPSSPDLGSVKVTAGDYNQGELAGVMQNRKIYADIISTWLKLGRNKKTIAFCVDIAHSEELANEFQAAGISAEAIHSKLDEERHAEIMRDSRSGKIKVLCSVAQIIKGYDDPSAVVAIIARPTKSLMLHIQMLGRVLRKHESKDKAIILDHANNLATLGLPTDKLPDDLCTLEKGERAEAKEREEPLPKKCPSCQYMKPPMVSVCPRCGHKPERFADIEILPGELKEFTATQKKSVKDKSMSELANWYGFFQSYQSSNNYNKDYADTQFKKKFGFDPKQKFAGEDIKWEPWSDEQKQWVKNKNLRSQYARGRFGGGRTHKQHSKKSQFDNTVQQMMNNP